MGMASEHTDDLGGREVPDTMYIVFDKHGGLVTVTEYEEGAQADSGFYEDSTMVTYTRE